MTNWNWVNFAVAIIAALSSGVSICLNHRTKKNFEEFKSLVDLSKDQRKKRIQAAEITGGKFANFMTELFSTIEACKIGYVDALSPSGKRTYWGEFEKTTRDFKKMFEIQRIFFSNEDKAFLDKIDSIVDEVMRFCEYVEDDIEDNMANSFFKKKNAFEEKQKHIVSDIQNIIHFYESIS